ncbi:biliverdin-producing heme oxygenase [Larkinella bovis]|uniref:Biliverdin-producing heme oxygenase n=1 Tax=Larkinella bovis TaxID=683041 RepID=A0ABW0IB39_9BACT
MSLAERLRHETRALHEETEQLLYTEPLRSGTLAPEQYTHLMQIHGLFHHALETAIDRHPVFFEGYQPDERRKSAWLATDLAALDASLPDLRPDLFADWSPVELLGAAYVGEGSMLGGKVVFHHLQKSPALQPLLQNARFYRGYGPGMMDKWKAFGVLLAARPEAEHDTVVEAAKWTFRTYQKLFRLTLTEKPAVG